MAAQTVTGRMSKHLVARLANLHNEIQDQGVSNIDVDANATTTITIVYTTSGGGITVDYAST